MKQDAASLPRHRSLLSLQSQRKTFHFGSRHQYDCSGQDPQKTIVRLQRVSGAGFAEEGNSVGLYPSGHPSLWQLLGEDGRII